jgi:hypothetical protein
MMRRVFTLVVVVTAIPAGSLPANAQRAHDGGTPILQRRVLRETAVRYQGRDNREEQTERFTRTLKVGAGGAIELGNVSGDIVITAGGGNEARLDVVKTARARTVDEAKELLRLVEVEIDERGGRAEVRTRYPGEDDRPRGRRNFNVSVAYTLTAPAGTAIRANSVSGDVSASDIKGELSLESVSGSITIRNGGRVAAANSVSGDVEVTNTTIDGALDASSVSGTVTLRHVKAGRLDAGSVSGDVVVEDVQCERVEAQSVSGNISFSGPLAPSGRYELQSHSGEVRMAITGGAGFEIEATSFSGSVRSDFELKGAQPASGRRQRSLRGVYGDGSAVLDLTTFSGSIVISKG